MKKVFIFGPAFQFGMDYEPIYHKIDKLCDEYFDKVLGTHLEKIETQESPEKFYKTVQHEISKSDLCIAEVSSQSLTVGIQLQMAQEHKISVIALVRDDVDLSKSFLLRGLPTLLSIVSYKDENDLLKKLEEELDEM